jgi:hypothetical protein
MRRILAALAIAAAVLLPATPALALVGRVSLFDGTGGGAPSCQGFVSQQASLTNVCNTDWSNRASSVQNQLAVDGAAKSCVVYHDGSSFTGAAWANHSQLTVNVPAGLNNAISSFRFGTWQFIPAIGQYGCTAPYS